MPPSAGYRLRRGLVGFVGAVIILGVGVYGSATLIGPLPAATATVVNVDGAVAPPTPPTLPQTGASGVIVGNPGQDAPSDATAADASRPLTAGIADAVPLGGTVKVITALVILDTKPLDAAGAGPDIIISPDDYAGYVTYISQSARAISFIAGESWSERDMLEAMLLGSSNNHADALARWAYGSVDGYLTAAQAWLAKRGLTGVTLADATGLSEQSVGTASDLTIIAQLAANNPAITAIMAQQQVTVNGNRTVTNLAAHLPELGITGLSLSYTDQAGLCFLYSATVTANGSTATFYGAMLREPDYDTLDADLKTLVASAATSLVPTTVVTKGDVFVRYVTAWGQSSEGAALSTDSRMLWAAAPLTHTVSAASISTALAGSPAGSVTYALPATTLIMPLRLTTALTDPGPLWRLTNPGPVVQAFLDSRK